MSNPTARIGHGYDLHRLIKGRDLILGGIQIPHHKGLLGHSDADCLIHAIADSIFGALGLPDIGHFFPDSDPENKDLDSEIILKKAIRHCEKAGYGIANLDSTIVAEQPKLQAYKERIRKNLAKILKINADQIGIKATTNEGIGPIGREEAIACYAVTLLVRTD